MFLSFPSLPQTCPLFLASCDWLEGSQCVCYRINTLLFTLSLPPVSHQFSPSCPFPLIVQLNEWLGYLTQPPVPSPAGCRNKQGLWCLGWLCHYDLLGCRRRSIACCSRCSKLHRPHCISPHPTHSTSPPDCLQLPLKGWDFIDAQSAFLAGQHAQNYSTFLQFQHTRFLHGALLL